MEENRSPQSEGPPAGDGSDEFDWIDDSRFRDAALAREQLRAIWRCGASADLLQGLRDGLTGHFDKIVDLDAALANLSRFVAASRDPISMLALFDRDPGALPALLQVFAASQTLANRLIADPASFDLLRASDGQPAERHFLVDELAAELASVDRSSRAAVVIRKFVSLELVRIAYGEFVRGLSPEKVGRQLAYVADAVIEAGLGFVTRRLAERYGMPTRADGEVPQVTVLGIGNLGGEEMGYASSMELVFLYDQIELNNPTHREFYATLVNELVALLGPEGPQALGFRVDLRGGPKYEVGTQICSMREAVRIFETSGRTWHRMRMVKARVVAGSAELGEGFLRRIAPWVYRNFLSRDDLAEIRTLRHRLERRAEQKGIVGHDIFRDPGGRSDLEMTVQFLQLLHGGDLASVRCANTYDAIIALEKAGCVTHQEATLLSENYARLCRLQHQLSVMFDRRSGELPEDPTSRGRLAWQLGIRASDGSEGDTERFDTLLRETFQVNQRMINHLMLDAPHHDDSVPNETELLLDPEPDLELVRRTMEAHRLPDATRAMEDLKSLSSETVSFLSPRRCRHFLAALAPALLSEVSRTPDPHAALSTLVRVADSLGAKATLWELLASNQPTLELMVRLCATTPYLSGILTENPGMIDELIDSLLMNRLPSAGRLDAHSIEVCRGAIDVEPILHSFKNSAHLTIGVRDMLGMDPIELTHASLADTAEACVRRLIEHEQESLAERFGDPVDGNDVTAELVTVALGKFGGREPNYHSDLDAIFLYTGEGETRRRMGGHRATLTFQQFFNQLAQRVIGRVNHVGPTGRLFELDSRMHSAAEDGLLAVSVDDFLKRFSQGIAPLWQRLALCRGRAISGSPEQRKRTDEAIGQLIRQTQWDSGMATEIREMRQRMQQTATTGNLKRGEGGTVDAECIAQMLTLRHAAESPQCIRQRTTDSLAALSEAGHLPEEHALELIRGYRTLRRVEANLRLMNTPERHELPEDEESMRNLAFLMHESDPAIIVALCQQARLNNRRVFDLVFESVVSSDR